MASRIYIVTTPKGVRLIDAAVKQNAIAFVAKDEITCEVASGHDIADLVGKGIKVETVAGPGNLTLPLDPVPVGHLPLASTNSEFAR